MTVRVFEGLPGEWEPSGAELVAAAEHAAERVERYERLAAEWNDELCRLAEMVAAEQFTQGALGRLAAAAGLTLQTLRNRRGAWRKRAGLGGD